MEFSVVHYDLGLFSAKERNSLTISKASKKDCVAKRLIIFNIFLIIGIKSI
jgi:hypothetical protein